MVIDFHHTPTHLRQAPEKLWKFVDVKIVTVINLELDMSEGRVQHTPIRKSDKYKAYEIITSHYSRSKNLSLGKHIVVATSMSGATLAINLKDGEGIVEIKELNHELVLPRELRDLLD